MTGEEKTRLAKGHIVNPEAYQLYLKGRYYWNKRTEEGFHKAIEHFNQAIEKDPNYTLAHAGLADSYILLGAFGLLPPKEAYAKAREAATKALEVDDTLGEAHNALAAVKSSYDWDRPGAEREYKRAIELNPGYATAHQWYGELLSDALGRHEEGLAEINHAQQLDPLSLIINAVHGRILLGAGRDDLAIEQLRKTLEMDPILPLPTITWDGRMCERERLQQRLPNYRGLQPSLQAFPITRLGWDTPTRVLARVPKRARCSTS